MSHLFSFKGAEDSHEKEKEKSLEFILQSESYEVRQHILHLHLKLGWV